MSETPKKDAPTERAEEARNLAKEAVDALKEGDREESSFLAGEAKQLDKADAEAVLRDTPPSKAR